MSLQFLLSTLFERNVFGYFGSDVFGTRANQAVVGVLFKHMRRPTGNAAGSEDWGIQIYGKAHHVVNRGGVEINITVEALMLFNIILNDTRYLVPTRIAGTLT